MKKSEKWILLGFVMGNLLQTGFVVLLLLFSGCIGSQEPEIIGTEYRDPPIAPDFNLINQEGENISLTDYQDKVIRQALDID